MKIDLNYDELREEAATDSDTRVRDAMKRLIGGFDRMIEVADDPDELVERIVWLTEQATTGRNNLRERKPIAALTSGSSDATSTMSPDETAVIDEMRERCKGDLTQIPVLLESLNNKLQAAKQDAERAQAELATEKTAHERTKNQKGSVDATIVANRDRLQTELDEANKAKDDLQTELDEANRTNDRLETELDDERDKVKAGSPAYYSMVKKGAVKGRFRSGEKFEVALDSLPKEHARTLKHDVISAHKG